MIKVEQHIQTYGRGKLEMFQLFLVKGDSKSITEI